MKTFCPPCSPITSCLLNRYYRVVLWQLCAVMMSWVSTQRTPWSSGCLYKYLNQGHIMIWRNTSPNLILWSFNLVGPHEAPHSAAWVDERLGLFALIFGGPTIARLTYRSKRPKISKNGTGKICVLHCSFWSN